MARLTGSNERHLEDRALASVVPLYAEYPGGEGIVGTATLCRFGGRPELFSYDRTTPERVLVTARHVTNLLDRIDSAGGRWGILHEGQVIELNPCALFPHRDLCVDLALIVCTNQGVLDHLSESLQFLRPRWFDYRIATERYLLVGYPTDQGLSDPREEPEHLGILAEPYMGPVDVSNMPVDVERHLLLEYSFERRVRSLCGLSGSAVWALDQAGDPECVVGFQTSYVADRWVRVTRPTGASSRPEAG